MTGYAAPLRWLASSFAGVALMCSCSNDGGGTLLPGTVDARGGTVASGDGRVLIVVPSGALTEPKAIVIAPKTVANAIPGTAYSFSPDGLTFAKPVTIAIKYDAAALPAGAPEAELRLAHLTEPVWQGVAGSTVDTGAKVVSGSVTHFSDYGGIAYACGNFVTLLDPRIPLIAPGATQQFTVNIVINERRIDVTPFSTFRSSDPGVATIVPGKPGGGLATGVGTGITTITATYGVCTPNEYTTTMSVLGTATDGGAALDGGVATRDGGAQTDGGAACSPACPAASSCMGTFCICSAGQVPCGRTGASTGTCCGPNQTCTNNQCVTRTTCQFECSGGQICQNGECECPALPVCDQLCPCPSGEVCTNGQCHARDGGTACLLTTVQCTAFSCCVGSCINRNCTCGIIGSVCNASPNFCCSGRCLPADSSGTRVCGCAPQGGSCAGNVDCCGGSCNTATQKCL